MITNEVMDNIFINHSHRISQWNHNLLSPPLLQEYAIMHAKGVPLKTCFAFIDGTVRPIAHSDQQQRIVYNGHSMFTHQNSSLLLFQMGSLGIQSNLY